MNFRKKLKGWIGRIDKLQLALFVGRTFVLALVWGAFYYFNPEAPRWANWLWCLLIVVRADLFDEIRKIKKIVARLADEL